MQSRKQKSFQWLCVCVALGLVITNQVDGSKPVFIGSEKAQAWVQERFTQAKAQKKEMVRLPLVHRSEGWGCSCPQYYLGWFTLGAPGNLWVAPKFASEEKALPKDTVHVVEGYFTGQKIKEDLTNGTGDPPEWIYDEYEFVVTKVIKLVGPIEAPEEENPDFKLTLLPKPVQ